MSTRPLTKAVLDFLTALEMAAPGMTSGLTLTLTDRLYTLLRDETPVLTGESLGRLHYWGGALEVRNGGLSYGLPPKPEHEPSKCILPPGHANPCIGPRHGATSTKPPPAS